MPVHIGMVGRWNGINQIDHNQSGWYVLTQETLCND
jgi:hypothetical protein